MRFKKCNLRDCALNIQSKYCTDISENSIYVFLFKHGFIVCPKFLFDIVILERT